MRVILHKGCEVDGQRFWPSTEPQDLPEGLAEAMLARGPEWCEKAQAPKKKAPAKKAAAAKAAD